MKNLLILTSLILSFTVLGKEKIQIPARETVSLTYEQFGTYNVALNNSSGKQIEVFVTNAETKERVSGFGLAPFGKVVVAVSKGQLLNLKNTNTKEVSINLDFVEPQKVTRTSNSKVNFTLHNSSAKSIPLVIPNVMNPNLSPLSNSGVSLQIGQKIYYRKGISKKLLLVVDEEIKNGAKIDVHKLIKKLEKDS